MKLSKKKITFFDGWTLGIQNIIRLKNEAHDRGFSIELIHFGSWGDDKNRKKIENIEGITVKDISYFGSKSIEEILKIEKPNLIGFLSTNSFPHRAVIRYSRKLEIPTFHLFHGLDQFMEITSKGSESKFKRIFRLRRHIPKQILYFVPTYMKSLLFTKSNIADYKFLFNEIFRKFLGLNVYPPHDSVPNIVFVFNNSEKEHAISCRGYRKEIIEIVGNPDFIKWGIKQADLGTHLYKKQDNSNIIYIDTALYNYGIAHSDEKSFFKYIKTINDQLTIQGFKFFLKPHPSTSKYLVSLLKKNKINIVKNSEFCESAKECKNFIIEPSSAFLLPAVLGGNIFLSNLFELKDMQYGKYIGSYPNHKKLYDVINFHDEIAKIESSKDTVRIFDWIRENSFEIQEGSFQRKIFNKLEQLS